jgi:hypothetical protein
MTTDEFCNNVLPSGSGFNCKWDHIKTQKNGSQVFETYYHNMNEHGYYDGFTKVRLTLPANTVDFRITLQGPTIYTDYNTREYMCDTIWQALEGRAFSFTDI